MKKDKSESTWVFAVGDIVTPFSAARTAAGTMATVILVLVAMPAGRLAASAAPPPMPMPTMAVPRLDKAPVIDGIMAEGEWDRAAACTGFVPAFGNLLAHVQTVVLVRLRRRLLLRVLQKLPHREERPARQARARQR